MEIRCYEWSLSSWVDTWIIGLRCIQCACNVVGLSLINNLFQIIPLSLPNLNCSENMQTQKVIPRVKPMWQVERCLDVKGSWFKAKGFTVRRWAGSTKWPNISQRNSLPKNLKTAMTQQSENVLRCVWEENHKRMVVQDQILLKMNSHFNHFWQFSLDSWTWAVSSKSQKQGDVFKIQAWSWSTGKERHKKPQIRVLVIWFLAFTVNNGDKYKLNCRRSLDYLMNSVIGWIFPFYWVDLKEKTILTNRILWSSGISTISASGGIPFYKSWCTTQLNSRVNWQFEINSNFE